MIGEHCTEACAARPDCTVCHRPKWPRGRDPGVYAANGGCDWDCPGYDQEPRAGHLWPSEWREHIAALDAEPGKEEKKNG